MLLPMYNSLDYGAELISMVYLSNQLSILRMDTGHSTDVFTVLQGLEQLAVPQHVHVLIRHEHLKRVHPLVPHQRLHLSPNL